MEILHEKLQSLEGKVLVNGKAEGTVLASTVALSFWGGVNAENGEIIDHHHPLSGQSVAGKVLVIPSSRGSCSGSGVILELLLNGHRPSALVFEHDELVVTLGVIVASEVFGKSIPIIQLSSVDFKIISTAAWVRINNSHVECLITSDFRRDDGAELKFEAQTAKMDIEMEIPPFFKLTSFDRELLDGTHGKAAEAAARIVIKMAYIQNATELIDIKQAHIDGCVYTGPATLQFAQQFNKWGAKVRIPASMNSISVDRRRWCAQGIDPALGNPASELADAYVYMGVSPSYTCAPYLLNTAPTKDDHITWGESNAAVFANSVLGARTIKCPDYLDICVALTGRAPNAGPHITANRRAQIKISLPRICNTDDSLFPLLGYVVGDIAANQIPIITGIEDTLITKDDLKAFSAAFATTSSSSMFHLAGITPEALGGQELEIQLSVASCVAITFSELQRAWCQLNSGLDTYIDLISLGNPHFSYDEFANLAHLCNGQKKSDAVSVVVTCGRDTYARAYRDGHIPMLEDFGVQVITDTCWCMIVEPLIPVHAKTIMTNSAKYAHYGVGLTGRQIRFGSLAQCIEAACSGQASHDLPSWLMGVKDQKI
ncbi:hypothetical protein B7463_g8168, partial [Scytalidium lignicola]